ncbi:hypothetical protein M5K25_012920 [Dendrobium thyrsiflorum]|uniref:Uncharacterized protein n=1 Tax=Dendrobium thyrsiflorum TaxID=117978 RepID=A0ABD0UZ15_DENTH
MLQHNTYSLARWKYTIQTITNAGCSDSGSWPISYSGCSDSQGCSVSCAGLRFLPRLPVPWPLPAISMIDFLGSVRHFQGLFGLTADPSTPLPSC